MSHRATGTAFCAIAAMLFATRYLTAAIYGSGMSSWSSNSFGNLLKYVGAGLPTAAAVSLLVGIAYLVIAERRDRAPHP